MTVEIRPLGDDLLDRAFMLATEVFVAGSSLHRALGIELAEYRAYLQPSFEAMVAEGLSVAVLDGNTLLGCLIATDFHQHRYGGAIVPNKLAPLAALTDALCDQYIRSTRKGEVVLVDMAAVSPTATGLKLYSKMRDEAQLLARKRGFHRVVGELSAVATQHVVIGRMKHNVVAEVVFEDFSFGGRYPFQLIEAPRSIVLAEGHL